MELSMPPVAAWYNSTHPKHEDCPLCPLHESEPGRQPLALWQRKAPAYSSRGEQLLYSKISGSMIQRTWFKLFQHVPTLLVDISHYSTKPVGSAAPQMLQSTSPLASWCPPETICSRRLCEDFGYSYIQLYGDGSKPCTPGEHQNSW